MMIVGYLKIGHKRLRVGLRERAQDSIAQIT